MAGVQSLSGILLFVTPWTAACQASLFFITSGVCSDSWPLSRWRSLTVSSGKSIARPHFWTPLLLLSVRCRLSLCDGEKETAESGPVLCGVFLICFLSYSLEDNEGNEQLSGKKLVCHVSFAHDVDKWTHPWAWMSRERDREERWWGYIPEVLAIHALVHLENPFAGPQSGRLSFLQQEWNKIPPLFSAIWAERMLNTQ